MLFDQATSWLREHEGQVVRVVAGSVDTNVSLTTVGDLRRDPGAEVTFVNRRPGRYEIYSLGEAIFVVNEGDLTSVDARIGDYSGNSLHVGCGGSQYLLAWLPEAASFA